MSWTHHVPWLFYLTRSHFWAQEGLSFCFSLCLSHPDACSDTSERIVGKISSGSLRKAPFFLLLASDLGNFGRTEWHSQTKLDRRPAICQALLRQIPLCRGKKKKKCSFSSETQWIKQKPTSSVLACKCGIWSKWNTCRQLNDKADPFEFLLSLEFLNMIICCALGYKTTSLSWKWQLAPTATWCCLCGIVVIYSHLKRNDWMALWFLPRNCGVMEYEICKLRWSSFLRRFLQAARWKLHENVGRTLDKVVLLHCLTQSPLFILIGIQCTQRADCLLPQNLIVL